MQPEIRITGQSLCGSSLQCGGVQGFCFASFDMYWPALLTLPYWPGRQSLEYFWNILDNFFLNPRYTFSHTCIVHCNTYILAPVFIYFLLDSGGGKGSSKHLPPAHNWRILNLEVVTLHRRSDIKRAYRPQAFF